MAFVKSFHTQSNNHSPALFMANTGVTRMGHPCVGSWVTYGLGTENENLPAFMVMSDPLGAACPRDTPRTGATAFLPGAFQGTWINTKGDPIPEPQARPGDLNDERPAQAVELPARTEPATLAERVDEDDPNLDRPHQELRTGLPHAGWRRPSAFDVEAEPEHIREACTASTTAKCTHFARQCLMARRMVERGVRFVQIYSGGMENQRSWDGHNDIVGNHTGFAGETDQPIAGC